VHSMMTGWCSSIVGGGLSPGRIGWTLRLRYRARARRHRRPADRLLELYRAIRAFAQPQIQHLHKNAETHREVDVPLRDVLLEALCDECHPDQQQEAQREHLHSWMSLDERTDGASREEHHAH